MPGRVGVSLSSKEEDSRVDTESFPGRGPTRPNGWKDTEPLVLVLAVFVQPTNRLRFGQVIVEQFNWDHTERGVSYLPLSHIAAQVPWNAPPSEKRRFVPFRA